jgi:hypothetical protein
MAGHKPTYRDEFAPLGKTSYTLTYSARRGISLKWHGSTSGRRQSMVAAALIGLGLLILFLNVGEAATLVRSLRIVGHEADSLGILTATAMAVRRTLQAYLFNHTEFLRVLYEVLLSFSGTLLIVTGMVFFGVMFAAGGESQKKRRGHVDFAASHSTHRWKQDSADNWQ